MTQHILVLGLNSFDSGKTLLSKSLIRHMISEGQRVEYFKPISGHNYWQKYTHTRMCMEEGIIFSSDVREVRQGIDTDIPVEVMNPIHTLFVPARLHAPEEKYRANLVFGGWDSVFAMQRFSHISEGVIQSVILLAKQLINDRKLLITKEEVECFTRNTEIVPVVNEQEIYSYSEQVVESILDDTLQYIDGQSDVVIIEGFNDSAWPWEGLIDVDHVLVVGPGHVFAYDPERFRKAVDLTRYRSQPIRETTVSRVIEMVKSIERIHVTPEYKTVGIESQGVGLLLERMIRH